MLIESSALEALYKIARKHPSEAAIEQSLQSELKEVFQKRFPECEMVYPWEIGGLRVDFCINTQADERFSSQYGIKQRVFIEVKCGKDSFPALQAVGRDMLRLALLPKDGSAP